MSPLNRIWKEIRAGENLDSYTTIIVAVSLSLLNALGVFSQSLSSLTLAILALLAITLLGNRHRLEKLSEQTTSSNKGFLLTKLKDEQQRELRERIIGCSEVLIFGTYLNRTLDEFYPLFETKIEDTEGKKHPFKISFLTVNPDSHAVDMMVMRKYAREDLETSRLQLLSTLKKFKGLNDKAPGRVETLVIDFNLTHGGILIDPKSSDGLLFIWYYGFRTAGGSLPKFIIRPVDEPWYGHFVKEAESLVKSSKQWQSLE